MYLKNISNLLNFSFRPLFALRILFLECETLLLGTASRKGGKRSSREDGDSSRDRIPRWSRARRGLKGGGGSTRAAIKKVTKVMHWF